MKRYLLIMASLLLAAIIGAVLVWYFLILAPIKQAQNQMDSTYKKVQETGSEFLDSTRETFKEKSVDLDSLKDNIVATEQYIKETTPIIIRKSNLPETQQSILTKFGFGEEIFITAEMKACAEAKLGDDRLAEIVAGTAPSFKEASSLVTCLSN